MQDGGIIAGADDFLPIFIYVMSRAQLQHVHSTIEFVTQYTDPNDKQDEPYYYFIQMTSAVAYLDSITVESVNEKIKEKRKLMEEAEEKERQRAAEEAAELERKEREEKEEQIRKERAAKVQLVKIPNGAFKTISSVVVNSNLKNDSFINNPPPLINPANVTPESYIKLLDSVEEVVPVCESKKKMLKHSSKQ